MNKPTSLKLTAIIFAGVLAMAVATIANAQESSTAADKTASKTPDKTKDTAKASTDATATSEKADASAGKTAPAKATKKSKSAKAEAKPAPALPKDIKKLVVEDTVVGSGKTATKGQSIKVNYTGWLYDPSRPMGRGRQFDSSVGKDAFVFKLGSGEVIKGWDEGFSDMKVGGKRKLIIPGDMAYGEHGAGTMIPPNAPLMFEVELVDVL